MPDTEVVIVGAGPTGLMLAGELALAGVEAAIVERRVNQDLIGRRAGGLHARTIEELEQRGIADRFLAEGQAAQIAGFAWIRLDMSDFPSRHPYGLALWQNRIEELLARWVEELGVPIRRGCEAVSFIQDDDGVELRLADGRSMRCRYMVGCDGGRSLVRKTAGIGFPGWDPTVSCLIAEADMGEEPAWGLFRDERGLRGVSRMEEGKGVRVMVSEAEAGATAEPTLTDLRRALIAAYGTDFGLRGAASISRFTDTTRQAAAYRDRRVLLAGDAAHVHFPAGGQGLNIGVQDAVNLGWKLAQVVRGTSSETLLDTYQQERHPAAARVLRNTMAQTALLRGDDRTDALRDSVCELLSLDEPRRRVAAMMSGLDIHYDLGPGHPLLGRRMPDLDLVVAGGAVRASALLHQARPVLLDLGAPASIEMAGWSDRVKVVAADYGGAWELPVLGAVAPPKAVLIRPDGYVAWVGQETFDGLAEALTAWFGPPGADMAKRPVDRR